MPLLTLGGTVTARPWEVRFGATLVQRLWLCDQIPLLGLAKLELPAIGYALEARGWGLDAKPQMAPIDTTAATIRMEHDDAPQLP
jgi:hypothetical protein